MVFFHNRLDEFVSLGLSDAMGQPTCSATLVQPFANLNEYKEILSEKKRYGGYTMRKV